MTKTPILLCLSVQVCFCGIEVNYHGRKDLLLFVLVSPDDHGSALILGRQTWPANLLAGVLWYNHTGCFYKLSDVLKEGKKMKGFMV